MSINFKEGDILLATENIIVQQVNHKGIMGAGLARQILNHYPDISYPYREFCKEHSYESISSMGKVFFYTAEKNRTIACVFGQKDYGTDKDTIYTDYGSLYRGLTTVRHFAENNGFGVAIPFGIGCGLGHGDWNIVYGYIKEIFSKTSYDDFPCTIYSI